MKSLLLGIIINILAGWFFYDVLLAFNEGHYFKAIIFLMLTWLAMKFGTAFISAWRKGIK